MWIGSGRIQFRQRYRFSFDDKLKPDKAKFRNAFHVYEEFFYEILQAITPQIHETNLKAIEG